jgi:hypothetical protein
MQNELPSALNPWLSIWTQPRATIQQIIDTNPTQMVLPLALMAGFGQAMDRSFSNNAGDSLDWPMIVVMSLLIGSITGVISLYVGAALLKFTGKWIGGEGNIVNIRASLAWGSVPNVCGILLWIPLIAIAGQELFVEETPILESKPGLMAIVFVLQLLSIVLGFWSFVAYLKCLGQVQGFSAWKALGNMILSALVVVIPIVLIVGGILLITSQA